MSNLTYIKTRIKNRQHLTEALQNLDFTLNMASNQTVSNPWHTTNVEFTARNNAGQIFGFSLSDGSDYSIIGASSQGISANVLEQEVINIENKIKREYAKSLTMKTLQEHGFSLDSETEENDRIVIKLSRIV